MDSMQNVLHILIVSDNVLARAGLAAMLNNHPDCVVIGQTTSESLMDAVAQVDLDIVLVDVGWQASDMLDELSLLPNDLSIVALLSDETDAAATFGILNRFFTYGVLLNENDTELLVTAMQAVMAGVLVIDPALSESLTAMVTISPEPIDEELTPREDEVLQLVAQGMTNKAIAHQLGITDHTVKFHVNAIMTKLGAQSRTDAVVRATRAGLIIL